jgi:FtsZ-binding cell division protein ZapB
MSDLEGARDAAATERELRETRRRLRDTSVALLEANQALAQIPLLEFRLEEVWEARQWLDEQNAGLRREIAELQEQNSRLSAGEPA